MKCGLQIDISYAREALKCEDRYDVLKTNISHAREALKCEKRHEIKNQEALKCEHRYGSRAKNRY